MNRVHPTCTERPSLNKECGWKGDDRSGLAHGQELTGRKRRTKISLQEKKKRKNILDTHRPSHGRHPHLSRHGNRIIEAEATALAGRTPQEDLNGLLRREWACRSGTDYLFQ